MTLEIELVEIGRLEPPRLPAELKLVTVADRPDLLPGLYEVGVDSWRDVPGVRRAARGRGLARTLEVTQILWAREHGPELLLTRNDERNAPILRLNESLGFTRRSGRIRVRGPLALAA